MSKFMHHFALALLLAPVLCAARPAATASRVPLPLVFEPNRGQAASPVQFLGRNAHYTLRLSPAQVEVLPAGGAAPLRIHFEGAGSQPVLDGIDPLPGRSFYYLGNHPELWQTNVPNFAKVRYRAPYPGIDMVFYGNAGQLEYDLIVAPHADPGRVRMRFDGARRLRLESSGDLRIETASGVLWQKRPVVYQESSDGRRQISGRYVVDGKRVHFAVDGYNPAEPLVIDPVLVYATYFGGKGDDSPQAMAVDAAGNAYVTGYTVSTDYPAVPQSSTNAAHGGEDVFVTKIDPTGQKVLYSVILGGTLDEEAYAVAADSAGNAYVVGTTDSTNFPTLNAYQSTAKGAWDAFALKLDASGNLLYSTYFGGGKLQPCGCDPDDMAYAVAVDSSGNAFVAGETWSADFPNTTGTFGRVPNEGDAFVTEFSSAGKLVFSTLIGGSNWDDAAAIAIGASGMVYVTGDTLSTDLPVTAGVVQKQNNGHGSQNTGDLWVAKINPLAAAGTSPVVALTYLGGANDEDVYAIKVDAAENVYLSGATLSTDFPVTAKAYQTTFGGGTDVGDGFIVKLNSALTSAIYSTYFGGRGDEFSTGLQLDSAGDVFVTGWTNSSALTPTSLGSNPTAVQSTFAAGYDGYLAELNPTGDSILYFTYLGQGGISWGSDMGMDAAGNLYLAFATQSTGMPIVSPALQSTLAGGQDLYLLKLTLPAVVPGNAVTISSINVSGGGPDIAQNTWIEIHGANLGPANLASGITWSSAPDFAVGKMPTLLQGVSVAIDGKPAYIYYVSTTQINALTPLDNNTGVASVTVTNGSNTSAPFSVNLKAVAPTFLLWSGKYIVAEHLDYTYAGPASFGSGFTPAQPGETITLFGTGFGLPSVPLVAGSASQSGALPNNPVFLIGGSAATVVYSGLVSPGLYQFDVVVPSSTADGDISVTASYGGVSTAAGAFISVQHVTAN
jgi:uncharacterized protein (TIGR03437 family)